jgi:hypothetical protein
MMEQFDWKVLATVFTAVFIAELEIKPSLPPCFSPPTRT